MARIHALWLRGGFPRSYLANSDSSSFDWRRAFIERDIPQFGYAIQTATLSGFWSMVAHHHEPLFNACRIGESLEVSHFNLHGWKHLSTPIEPWSGDENSRCRLLTGMQRLPQDELRKVKLERG